MVSYEKLIGYVKSILVQPFWIAELKTMVSYSRIHDDNDGDVTQAIELVIDQQGDVYVRTMAQKGEFLRFRTSGGGGDSLRVRNALVVLAYAISLDNETKPQRYS